MTLKASWRRLSAVSTTLGGWTLLCVEAVPGSWRCVEHALASTQLSACSTYHQTV